MTSISEAADKGERELLVALRAQIAQQLDDGPPAHALAALVRQVRELDHDIRAIDEQRQETSDDDETPDGDFDPSTV